MYYNTRTDELYGICPKSGTLADGSLVQGLDIAEPELQALCGIIPVVSDTPPQPANSYEDVTSRLVTVEDGEATVVRTWLPNPVVVPSSISARQIRLWLVTHGVSLQDVDAAIQAIPDATLRAKTKVEWEYAPYCERNHPMVATIGEALEMDDEAIDQAFVEAAQL